MNQMGSASFQRTINILQEAGLEIHLSALVSFVYIGTHRLGARLERQLRTVPQLR